jgi:haloalkane dehalogenase
LSDLQPRPLRLADHIDNLVRLIDALDLERVTLIAQDWGGAIGLGAMLRERQRFERIVLFNTGAFRPWFIPWRIRVCRTPVFGRLAVQGGNAFSRAALTMTLGRKRRLEPDVAAGYLAPYDSWQRRAAVQQFVEDIPLSPRHPTWATLGEIEDQLPTLADVPALLVWGMRDWCFTPECLERFVAVWPRAEVHRLADVGHWVVEDAPEEAATHVELFLRTTAGSHAR